VESAHHAENASTAVNANAQRKIKKPDHKAAPVQSALNTALANFMNGSAKKTEKAIEPQSFGAKLIEPRLGELAKVLPSQEATEAFARIAITALNKQPKLRDCTPESILSCIFDLASINLQPNTPNGHCWIIPYGNQATVQLGFKGFAELAYRSGNVKLLQADSIREGDQFKYLKGVGEAVKPFVEHVRSIGKGRSQQALLGAWASCELINGGVTIEVMDSDDIQSIRRLAAQGSPAWKQFEDEMAKKSVVKRLLKLQQLSNMETLRKAIELDNAMSGIVLPTNGNAHAAEHKLILKDEEHETDTVIEPESKKAGNGEKREDLALEG
jgi:recombination protein RecT